jgi:sarcosine oxidase subunit delta
MRRFRVNMKDGETAGIAFGDPVRPVEVMFLHATGFNAITYQSLLEPLGGQAHVARPADPSAVSDADWAAFLYFRDNPRGPIAERWRHTHGCGRFFNAVRDTVTDVFETTYKAGEPRK